MSLILSGNSGTSTLDSSNGLSMAVWTTATRPSSPTAGQLGYNTTFGGMEMYNGSAWDCISGGPAFSYYASTGTSMSSGNYTKMIYDTKEFDTANAVSNSRFQPTLAGYYYTTAQVYWGLASRGTECLVNFYKNGTVYKQGFDTYSSTSFYLMQSSVLVYLNGTTDYLEIYAYAATGSTTNTGNTNMWWQGYMVRGV